MSAVTNEITIPYSDELLWALQMQADEFAVEARELLAVKLYEMEASV